MAPPPDKVLQPQTIAKDKSAKSQIENKNSSKQMVPAKVVVNEVIEAEERVADDPFSDIEFDGISDDDDDDTDGLLIPLENGWVCEKRLADSSTNSYSTHFWSPDGHRHSSLTVIKSYGAKKKLKLSMTIFERALKNNPHK